MNDYVPRKVIAIQPAQVLVERPGIDNCNNGNEAEQSTSSANIIETTEEQRRVIGNLTQLPSRNDIAVYTHAVVSEPDGNNFPQVAECSSRDIIQPLRNDNEMQCPGAALLHEVPPALLHGAPPCRIPKTRKKKQKSPSSACKEKKKILQQTLRRAQHKIVNLEEKIEDVIEELNSIPKKVRENMKNIINNAGEGGISENVLLDQLQNYGKKTNARWNQYTISHCIIAQSRAPGVYEFLRNSNFLHLPCKDTLRSYTGRSTLETGVSPLVSKRLKFEANQLSEIEKHGSLILDEMTFAPSEKYVTNLQKFCGQVDMGGVVDVPEDNQLANKMLGFVYVGLSTSYKIPVAYFLVNQLTAEQQYLLLLDVIKKVEETSCKVVRVVTDNLSTNVTMFAKFNMGTHAAVVPHPVQPLQDNERLRTPYVYRPLFLSYDSSHLIKNIRNQFLSRNFEIGGEPITPKFARLIFEKQKGELAKAVRHWTQKEVNPNSLEKQKVKPAMAMFRPDVTAAIEMHAELGTEGFENVIPTVTFMKKIHRWISLHDICNVDEYYKKRLFDKKPFFKSSDTRLNFLEHELPNDLRLWEEEVNNLVKKIPPGEKEKKKLEKDKFLTKETYNALLLTSRSTVECIRFLLDRVGFKFVLTRRFNSDSVEQLFSAIRQMTGGNFKGDATSV